MNTLRFNVPKLTPWLHWNGLVHLCFKAQQRWVTVCLDHEIDPLDFVPEDDEAPTCVRCIVWPRKPIPK
jgi:hypothetical protein